MPSLAVTQPQYPRSMDLMDADSFADRQLQSALGAVAIALQALRALKYSTDPKNTTTVTEWHYPLHVATGERATYQGYVSTAGDPASQTLDLAGAVELAAELQVRLGEILAL